MSDAARRDAPPGICQRISDSGHQWLVSAESVATAERLLLIQAISGDPTLLPWSSAFEAVLYFYAAAGLIRYMLADHQITRDELFAVGATFTLVAWAFAYVYTVCQAIEPGSFTAAVQPHADRTWMELLFLSFTTLTSTGTRCLGCTEDGTSRRRRRRTASASECIGPNISPTTPYREGGLRAPPRPGRSRWRHDTGVRRRARRSDGAR